MDGSKPGAPVPASCPKPGLYRVSRFFLHLLFRVWFRIRSRNPERVPDAGPVILASNHASFLDPPAVGMAMPRMCNYLARVTLFKNPLLGWWLRNVGVVPLDRDGGSASGLRTIIERLRQGNAILLFPEGTRTRDGQLQPARSGVGLIVLKSGATVVPTRVVGSYEAFGRHRLLPRPCSVEVRFGQPLRFDAQRAEAEACSKERLKEIYQQVSDDIMRAIAAL